MIFNESTYFPIPKGGYDGQADHDSEKQSKYLDQTHFSLSTEASLRKHLYAFL